MDFATWQNLQKGDVIRGSSRRPKIIGETTRVVIVRTDLNLDDQYGPRVRHDGVGLDGKHTVISMWHREYDLEDLEPYGSISRDALQWVEEIYRVKCVNNAVGLIMAWTKGVLPCYSGQPNHFTFKQWADALDLWGGGGSRSHTAPRTSCDR
jgi:hypothetical protein